MKNKLILLPFIIKIKNFFGRFLTTSVYIGNGKILVNTVLGQRLYVFGNDTSVGPHLLVNGLYEPEVTRAILKIVKPGMTVLEIGANVGYHTTLFGILVGKTGRVIAFEAFPKTYELLLDNIHINGLDEIIKPENMAVYNTNGTVSFSFLEKQHGSSGILEKSIIENLYKDTATLYTLPSVTVDSYIKANLPISNTNFDIVKIDAEGAEPFILEGMDIILSQDHVVLIVEIAQTLLEKAGHSVRDFLVKIEKYGLTPYEIKNSGKLLQVTFEQVLQNRQYRDVVFMK